MLSVTGLLVHDHDGEMASSNTSLTERRNPRQLALLVVSCSLISDLKGQTGVNVKHVKARSELFQRRRQGFHSSKNSLLIGSAIAKEQPSARQRLQAEGGDGHDLDAHLCSQFGRALIIFIGREP